MRPNVGRSPARPHRADGLRIDPLVSLPLVVLQSGYGRGMQGHPPRLVELGLSDVDEPHLGVNVGTVQANRLAQPHPGRGEQPEQRLVRCCPERRMQRAGSRQ